MPVQWLNWRLVARYLLAPCRLRSTPFHEHVTPNLIYDVCSNTTNHWNINNYCCPRVGRDWAFKTCRCGWPAALHLAGTFMILKLKPTYYGEDAMSYKQISIWPSLRGIGNRSGELQRPWVNAHPIWGSKIGKFPPLALPRSRDQWIVAANFG